MAAGECSIAMTVCVREFEDFCQIHTPEIGSKTKSIRHCGEVRGPLREAGAQQVQRRMEAPQVNPAPKLTSMT
jgi:hypothetical protein